MGLLLRALVERLWSSAAHATPFAVTLRSRPALSTRFNLVRFPAPGAAGAVWEDFLETSLVCLRGRPVDAPRLNLQSHRAMIIISHFLPT